MRLKRNLAIAASLLASAGCATAATLASAPTYGGVVTRNGGFVSCRLFNAGTATATIPVRQIFDGSGNLTTPIQDGCATLGASKSCQVTAQIPGNLSFACKVVWSGAGANLRGVTEVQDTGNNVLATSPMR